MEEEIKEEVKRESSFEVDLLEMLEIGKDDDDNEIVSHGTKDARTFRSVQESMLCHHFGEIILGSLFVMYGRMVDEEVESLATCFSWCLMHYYTH